MSQETTSRDNWLAEMRHASRDPHAKWASSSLEREPRWDRVIELNIEDLEPLSSGQLRAEFVAVTEAFGAWRNLSTRIDELANELRSVSVAISELVSKGDEQPTTRVVALHELGRGDMKLRRPINVVVEEYEGEVVARFPEVEAFGSGDSEFEAIENLKGDIASLLLDVSQTSSKQLGRAPKRWLEILSSLIERSD